MTTDGLGVLVSRADDASIHIGEQLREIVEWDETVDDDHSTNRGGGTVYRRPGVELRTIEERHLDTVGIAEIFDDPRLIAIASRHSGNTGPLLTAHYTGNFGPAEHGGTDNELARAAPHAHKRALAAFDEYAPEGYDVGMECTHHGPSDVGAPSLFLEVGSGQAQWRDPEAARAVAKAILELANESADRPLEHNGRRHVVGFGDGHYAPRFERIVRETDWAVGHVAADWSLDAMGDPADSTTPIDAAFTESAAEFAVVAGDRPDLEATIEGLGYRVVSETCLRETDGVALGLVETLEDVIGPVSEGLRFGTAASDRDVDTDVHVAGEIPEELLAVVTAVDRGDAVAAVESIALGYDTIHSGSQLAGPVALAEAANEAKLLEEFLDILGEEYDHVERRDDELVLRRTEFDPDLARDLGVSPGPDFGRLAEGTPVTIDGTRITPEEVSVEREKIVPTSVIDT